MQRRRARVEHAASAVMLGVARLARRIVDAIAKDKARVVAGPDAHALDLWAWVAPGRTRLIGRFTGRMEASAYGD